MTRSPAATTRGCDRSTTEDRKHGSIFTRVVCGVDDSRAGLAAARLAARVASPNGALVLLSVDNPEHVGETHVLVAHSLDALLAEVRRRDATLVVVGIHEHTRAVGIALGSVATHLLHEAPRSVLVVPARDGLDRWPSSIAVGLDGSPQSAAAASAARELARRFEAPLRAIVATKDSHIDLEEARRLAPDLEEDDGRAVDALVVASESADLVVVGSRGLRGIRALGSVSEQVAHEARCPVLVVRSPSH